MEETSALDRWIARTAQKSGLLIGWGLAVAFVCMVALIIILQIYAFMPDNRIGWSGVVEAIRNHDAWAVTCLCVGCGLIMGVIMFIVGLLLGYADSVKDEDPVESITKQTMVVGLIYGVVALLRRPHIITDIVTMFKHALTLDLSEADEVWFRDLHLSDWHSYVQAFDFDSWGRYCILCLLFVYFFNAIFKHKWMFEGGIARRMSYPVGMLVALPIGALFTFPIAYAGVAWLLIIVTTVVGAVVGIAFIAVMVVLLRTGFSAAAASSAERRERINEMDGLVRHTADDGTEVVHVEGSLWRARTNPDQYYEERIGGYVKVEDEE